ncbi:MAG TPA: Rossmann-like and DUF2520 domain-containing protein [Oxalicibacterium sp.]|uniref:Rossmann-like and DUF2520 domain-containing protein n=1 Tax=Oxalicibacterium sp. TaxID=2766525 RepID=UPI002C0BB5D0|nr:Rossmann-like and DUF2520 domain-containing protein [Oxalicibacterium sp.]HWU97351.1 Rossmann-like and DUF2520 domain-containing protein [Oxalicibacterium sp.]
MTRTLTIIGCGKVGQTLARLWHLNDTFAIGDVLNRSVESARSAVQFIGAGRVVAGFDDLRPADFVLIAPPDDQIAACSAALAASGCLTKNSIVFHCSGASPSSILEQAQHAGAAIASVHPIRSFAQPEKVVRAFAGTYCGVEGDQRAIDLLNPLFTAVGAHFVHIDRQKKTLYHAGAVFASNYMVTLLDTAVQTYVEAGMSRDDALKIMATLVRETAENVLQSGPEQALTGPVSRGDVGTVVRQYRAVRKWHRGYGNLYRQLGKLTRKLAHRRDKRRAS